MGDRIGQQFGNYRLVRLLGKGGFAEVYLGEHIHLETQVAIKVLHTPLVSDDVERFLSEAHTSAHLTHPHIVRVFDFGVKDTVPFLVMEYAPYGTVRTRYPTGSRLPPQTIVTYVKQVAVALSYVHEQKKLVHRDVKPENMLLRTEQDILLSDFGIVVEAHTTGSFIGAGQDGTLAYMAPEQLQGKPRPASDQYALGIIVYELLCGSCPFQGSFAEIASQHLLTPPPRLQEKVPSISTDVEQVVLKALAKNPKERFASVQAFATALEQAFQEEKEQAPSMLVAQQSASHPLLAAPSEVPSLTSNRDVVSRNFLPSLDAISLKGPHSASSHTVPTPNQSSISSPHTVPAFPPHQPVGETPSSLLQQANAPAIRTQHRSPSRGKVVLLIGLALLVVGTIIGTMLQFWATHQSVQRGSVVSRFTISSTSLLAKDYSLHGVAALSANDIWVIGDNIRRPPRPQALFKHWNGSQWSIYPDPASETETVSLRAIAAASPSDVWAVGQVAESSQPLIQHWNGSRWSVVPSPMFVGGQGRLLAVTAISANDAWAVGYYSPSDLGTTEWSLIEHWNGTRWSMIPSPHPGIGGQLSKVEAISANNVWAVGELIMHWDGMRWSVVKSPNLSYELSSVTVVSAHDIWAVGSFRNIIQGQYVWERLILHWDGSQWSVVESPILDNMITLRDVAALSPNDVWAVGYETGTGVHSQTLIEHWDGTQWSVVKSPGPGTDNELYGMDHVPHSNTIIVVGTMFYGNGETGTVLYITIP